MEQREKADNRGSAADSGLLHQTAAGAQQNWSGGTLRPQPTLSKLWLGTAASAREEQREEQGRTGAGVVAGHGGCRLLLSALHGAAAGVASASGAGGASSGGASVAAVCAMVAVGACRQGC